MKILVGPKNAPKREISWATLFENEWKVNKNKCHENCCRTTNCPKTPNIVGYNLLKRVKSYKK
jgi:hypothetical protein